ncbi:MAG TPA: cobalamin-independent methionine synthase II family protein, partial [Baekduia sp.]|nr:cobalamin-independent methionine synthase II family protein [Baekduia sp.]
MKRSTDRILTSHVGSLPRTKELLGLYANDASAETIDATLATAVDGIVKRQREIGIDIVNDGDYGKPSGEEVDYSAWMNYTYDRLTGFEMREFPKDMFVSDGEFADYESSPEAAIRPDPDAPYLLGVNVGEITYTGQAQIQRDIENLKAAVGPDSLDSAFIAATTVGLERFTPPSEHYAGPDEQAVALAEAMREEFKAITDAGLILQIDDPWIAWAFGADGTDFDAWANEHIELINHSIEGIPSDQIRFHVCWGSDKGPHVGDMPLAGNLEMILRIDAGLYSVEAANPRHEHEWRAWQDVKLPEGKSVMPGVITHKTNVVEHPEVIADRIVNYANAVGRENVIAGTDCGM